MQDNSAIMVEDILGLGLAYTGKRREGVAEQAQRGTNGLEPEVFIPQGAAYKSYLRLLAAVQDNPTVRVEAILGLGLAYAGKRREKVAEQARRGTNGSDPEGFKLQIAAYNSCLRLRAAVQDNPTIRVGAILGLGLAYAGKRREEVAELLSPLLGDPAVSMEVAAFAALALGLVFVGSCHEDCINAMLQACLRRACVL